MLLAANFTSSVQSSKVVLTMPGAHVIKAMYAVQL